MTPEEQQLVRTLFHGDGGNPLQVFAAELFNRNA